MSDENTVDGNELLGKDVLWETGHTYESSTSKWLRKIEKVTKTGYRISGQPDRLFSLRDGQEKGLQGKQNMAMISQCTVITPAEAFALCHKWAETRKKAALVTKLTTALATATLAELLACESILFPTSPTQD